MFVASLRFFTNHHHPQPAQPTRFYRQWLCLGNLLHVLNGAHSWGQNHGLFLRVKRTEKAAASCNKGSEPSQTALLREWHKRNQSSNHQSVFPESSHGAFRDVMVLPLVIIDWKRGYFSRTKTNDVVIQHDELETPHRFVLVGSHSLLDDRRFHRFTPPCIVAMAVPQWKKIHLSGRRKFGAFDMGLAQFMDPWWKIPWKSWDDFWGPPISPRLSHPC